MENTECLNEAESLLSPTAPKFGFPDVIDLRRHNKGQNLFQKNEIMHVDSTDAHDGEFCSHGTNFLHDFFQQIACDDLGLVVSRFQHGLDFEHRMQLLYLGRTINVMEFKLFGGDVESDGLKHKKG